MATLHKPISKILKLQTSHFGLNKERFDPTIFL